MKEYVKFETACIFVLLLNSIFFAGNMYGQTMKAKNVAYIPDIEVRFSHGINYYQNGNYEIAKDVFNELIKSYPAHQRITACYVLLGGCYYKLERTELAVSVLNELLKNYPQSNYVKDAHYLLGFCYYRMAKYFDSLKEFLLVADLAQKKKLAETSRNFALKIIDNNIPLTEIEQLREKESGKISVAILTIKSALRHLSIGKRERAISLLQNFTQQHPQNPYISYIEQLLKNTNTPLEYKEVKIGVILPLSGEYAEQAHGVLAGIRYAQKTFNNSSAVKINLVIKDSEGDIIKVVRAAQELSVDNRVVAILGELERDKTIAVAAVINDRNIPLITPTTSGNGVTSLNEYTYQVNTDLENRGRILAEYAVNKLGLKTFATLAPADNYGKNMTDSFTLTIDALGGTIVAQKWYYAGTEDLGRQFKSIRELGFNMMNKDSLIRAYTGNLTDFQRKRFDREDIPVTSIDGIFFPGYADDIKFIAPQFAFVNVRAKMFGGEYWNDPEQLRKVQKYVEGMTFCSSYHIDETDPEYIKFRNDFRLVMKRTPEIMELYGIDAMSVILDAIRQKKFSREDIGSHLNNLENFEGFRGPISIKGNNRINSQIRLFTYRNGRVEPIQ
ncbi:penicillin-binding protein activator [candidate division KSB1 bacterium]|nr:penicillin-binding protein activator [candidate division KSB1 bacterium]MBL7095397.1 penicillin-binding protein activator [candidate division KSB1 bacterium]